MLFPYSTDLLFSLQEFKTIRNFKRDVCGQRCVDLEPWDEAYYTAMMKSSAYNLDSSVSYKLLSVLLTIYNE